MQTAGMAAKAGNPVGAAAPNAAPAMKSVALGGSLRATKVVAPAKVAAAGAGPSAAPACTNRKILKVLALPFCPCSFCFQLLFFMWLKF